MSKERKLLAIINGDIVGYSRMMADDEDATIDAITQARDAVGKAVVLHNGRLVDFTGDNFLAEFSSATQAANCSIAIQRHFNQSAGMQFRLGVHVGEVVVDGERLFGSGINMASRLESLADTGGICMSKALFDLAERSLEIQPTPMGAQTLKGFEQPVYTYTINAASIVGTQTDQPTASALPMARSVPTIAVLPFTGLSTDAEHSQIAAGITSDVISGLSCDQRLSVISFSATQLHQDRDKSLKEIGQLLGASYLAEGALRFSGNRMRATIALIDAETETEIWGDKRDFDIDDLFDAIDEIVEVIVIALASHLRLEESNRFQRKPPKEFEAWALVGQAYQTFVNNAVVPHEGPLKLAEKAVAIDPSYAFGWAVLGFLTAFKYPLGLSVDHDADIQKSFEATAEALLLDPRDPMALTARAIALQYAGRPEESLEFLQLSLRLNPSDTLTHCYYGRGMMFSGKPELALAHFERFERLNPNNPAAHMAGMYHGLALMFMQRWVECEAVARRAHVAAGERNSWVSVTLAVTLAAQAKSTAARDALRLVEEHTPHWNLDFVNRFLTDCQADKSLVQPITEILSRIWTNA